MKGNDQPQIFVAIEVRRERERWIEWSRCSWWLSIPPLATPFPNAPFAFHPLTCSPWCSGAGEGATAGRGGGVRGLARWRYRREGRWWWSWWERSTSWRREWTCYRRAPLVFCSSASNSPSPSSKLPLSLPMAAPLSPRHCPSPCSSPISKLVNSPPYPPPPFLHCLCFRSKSYYFMVF